MKWAPFGLPLAQLEYFILCWKGLPGIPVYLDPRQYIMCSTWVGSGLAWTFYINIEKLSIESSLFGLLISNQMYDTWVGSSLTRTFHTVLERDLPCILAYLHSYQQPNVLHLGRLQLYSNIVYCAWKGLATPSMMKERSFIASTPVGSELPCRRSRRPDGGPGTTMKNRIVMILKV